MVPCIPNVCHHVSRIKNEMKLRMLRRLFAELCDQVETIRATGLEQTAWFARPNSQKWKPASRVRHFSQSMARHAAFTRKRRSLEGGVYQRAMFFRGNTVYKKHTLQSKCKTGMEPGVISRGAQGSEPPLLKSLVILGGLSPR